MSVISRTIEIDASAEQVWETLADFGNIADWSPNVRASHLTSAAGGGVGATRHCDVSNGSFEERIVAWSPGRSLTIEVFDAVGAPSRASHAVVTFEVEAAGDRSVVTATIDYALKGGFLGSILDALVGRRQFGRTLEQLVAGLREHVTTGEPIEFGRPLAYTSPVAA